MLINYILWLLTGLFVGLLGHIFEINKKKDLEAFLLVGPMAGFLGGFLVNFLIWPVPVGEVNIPSIILGGIFALVMVKQIDYFFHL